MNIYEEKQGKRIETDRCKQQETEGHVRTYDWYENIPDKRAMGVLFKLVLKKYTILRKLVLSHVSQCKFQED